ncbi:MAG TPA: glutathione peroxidase [Bacteroidales bacterium]|nr:glutathione peroxidase [Bacteroidales bacterium]
MKKWIVLAVLVTLVPLVASAQVSFYDFTVKDINGNDFNFSQLKGKKVMVVNTASKCGFTPQYADLEKLYEKYKDDGFVIIGFPANNFHNQEPGTNSEIKAFCKKNYGVSFPMMSKISVKGDDMSPVYKWLTTKKLNGEADSDVRWNFQKYLISRDGKLVKVIYSKEKPDSNEVVSWIEK